MLALEVLLQHMRGRGGGGTVYLHGVEGHAGDLLQHHGMVHGLRRVLAPGEGAVVAADHAGHMHGVDIAGFEGLHDDHAGVVLVARVNLLGGQAARAGHGAVEVVGVCGAVAGDVAAGLGPAHRVRAVGVHDAAQLRERLVEHQMGLGVGGGVEGALDDLAVQGEDHQLVGGQILVGHAGGLDDHQPFLPVDAGHVAPRVGDKAPAGQFHVGLIDGLFQRFKHKSLLR